MKNATFLVLLLLSFSVFAQDDDFYCTCQETQQQEAEIFSFVSEVNTQISIMVPQDAATFTAMTMPQIVEEPEEIRIFIPEEEEIENDRDIVDEEEDGMEMEARSSVDRSKFKKVKKKFKKRLKRRKRTKKYKGKCPFF